jgi:hypothetical protein
MLRNFCKHLTFFILSQMCDGPYVWCYIFIVQKHPPSADWLLDIIHNFVLLCTILFVSLMVGFVFLSSRPRPPPVVFLKLCWILLLICMLYVYHREVIADMIVTHPVKWQCKCHSFNHDHEDAGIVAVIVVFPCSRGLDSEADGLPFCQNIYGKNSGILSD